MATLDLARLMREIAAAARFALPDASEPCQFCEQDATLWDADGYGFCAQHSIEILKELEKGKGH